MKISSFPLLPRQLVCLLAAGSLLAPMPVLTPAMAQPVAPASSASALPAMGDVSTQSLSPAAERRLGDRIMRSILGDPDVVDDPVTLEYVNDVWQDLLRSARQRGDISTEMDELYAWRPFLVRERSVNAFALPGGYIGVHLGLLAMTGSPDELASVMAHELSHVTQRHIARMMSEQSRQSLVSLVSMILGAVAIARAPQAGQALIVGGQAASIQGQLNFSRDMEREADRVGFGVLTDAGFSPAGMAQMFEHLQTASRLNDDNSYPYLRTHPLTTERIGEARSRLGTSGWNPNAPVSAEEQAWTARHAMLSARAKALMDIRSASLQPLVAPNVHPDMPPLQSIAQYYLSAVASRMLRDGAQASASLKAARERLPLLPEAQRAEVDRLLTLEEVDLDVSARQAWVATNLLHAAPSRNSLITPTGRPELLLAAQAALNLPDTAGARSAIQDTATRLQTHVSAHPLDATAWAALAPLWQRLGYPLRAVRAEAEATAANGDLPGAIDRIEGGRKLVKRPSDDEAIELSVMQSRLRAWQRQQREDMKEDGGP